MRLSARNQLAGTVKSVKPGVTTTHVIIEVAPSVNIMASIKICWQRRAAPDVELQSGVDAYDAANTKPGEHVVVVGPTAGLYPDALLRRGVDVLGGVRVTAPDALLDVLAEGDSGYHFCGRSAEKVVLVRKTQAVASCAA